MTLGAAPVIPTIQAAKDALGPVHPRFVKVIVAAWAEWKIIRRFRTEQGFPPPLYDRTVSNDIFDGIARQAIREFGPDSAFILDRDAQSFKLRYKDFCLRFKKGDDDKLGMNWNTQAVLDFTEAEGLLPGLPPETAKLEIIWMANAMYSDLASVHVVARDGDKLIWEYPLDLAAADDVIPLPMLSVEPDDDLGQLVKPKATPKTDADDIQ